MFVEESEPLPAVMLPAALIDLFVSKPQILF
jgi:hypothetical protein